MGLGASSFNILRWKSRDFDITFETNKLELSKTALTRQMQQVTSRYQQACSAKTLQWSSNSGVTYSDISYELLMRPNAANAKSPAIITDSSGKVVVDTNYRKYAEMLSPNGDAGATWGGDVKNKILAELTGISESDIKAAQDAEAAADKAAETRNDALEALDIVKSKEPGVETLSIDKLAKKLGTYNGNDLSLLYSKAENGNYSVKSASDISELIKAINTNLSKYFNDDEALGIKDRTKFNNACEEIADFYKGLTLDPSEKGDKNRELYGLKGSYNDWTIDISQLLKMIMGAYEGTKSTDGNGNTAYVVRDASTSAWASWHNEYVSKKNAFTQAETAYSDAVNISNQCLTADKESDIEYYNLLFQAIADNGWKYDAQVNDSDYLTQTLQNNTYCITNITKNDCYDPDALDVNCKTEFFYDTDVALNCKNIFSVNNNKIRQEGFAEYQDEKRRINAKETAIDERINRLQIEQAALKKMIESAEKIAKENIERTYKLWA